MAGALPEHLAIAAGWHRLSGQLVKMGWQFSGSQVLDEIHVPFFGAFGAACDGAIVARWSANSLGML